MEQGNGKIFFTNLQVRCRHLYKICMDKVNVSITDKCSYGGEDEFWNCPKANKGLAFEQCYNM